jgi:hypothetical protein
VILAGRRVAPKENKAVILERQSGVVQPRRPSVAEIATLARLPGKPGPGLCFWDEEDQRKGHERCDQIATAQSKNTTKQTRPRSSEHVEKRTSPDLPTGSSQHQSLYR